MTPHKIYTKDNKTYIERAEYPRFRAEITFSDIASDIENVEWLDDIPADVMLIAKVMREAGDYIMQNSKS